jgi:hypothetical protein
MKVGWERERERERERGSRSSWRVKKMLCYNPCCYLLLLLDYTTDWWWAWWWAARLATYRLQQIAVKKILNQSLTANFIKQKSIRVIIILLQWLIRFSKTKYAWTIPFIILLFVEILLQTDFLTWGPPRVHTPHLF